MKTNCFLMCLCFSIILSSCNDDEELIDRSCPDTNHPHMIDLGLPSGTKWACCNVGATNPEEYGDYYAWGELRMKHVYSIDTYKYYNNDVIHIGDDIAGSEYDMAHLKLGGSWRMPSADQMSELMKYCAWTWTQLKGVYGIFATGPNGATLFLPAAGWFSSVGNDDFSGSYWSSSLCPSNESRACYLLSSSGGWYLNNGGDRSIGLSVRAVCP